ncbi:MAG: hypothetical protein MZV65_33625 [Chromatiales bacterium]|nr:hypothetical protein [Chromatiales bacterium]
MATVLIVGCGYLGRRVAQRERGRGGPVLALVRSAESEAKLKGRGLDARRVDLDDPQTLAGLPTAPH